MNLWLDPFFSSYYIINAIEIIPFFAIELIQKLIH